MIPLKSKFGPKKEPISNEPIENSSFATRILLRDKCLTPILLPFPPASRITETLFSLTTASEPCSWLQFTNREKRNKCMKFPNSPSDIKHSNKATRQAYQSSLTYTYICCLYRTTNSKKSWVLQPSELFSIFDRERSVLEIVG